MKNESMIMCNTGFPPAPSKSRSFPFYLDAIKELGLEFDRLEAFSTAGDIRPPYAYQWRATTKILEGWDDPFEGLGGTPLEAIIQLWRGIKKYQKNAPEEDEENITQE